MVLRPHFLKQNLRESNFSLALELKILQLKETLYKMEICLLRVPK
jgi:hypothetical protein